DPLVAPAKIGVLLQDGVSFAQFPSISIGRSPILSEDESTDFAVALEFAQVFLDCDADVASHSGGTISVNEFEEGAALRFGMGQGGVQLGEGVAERGLTGFEINDRDR